MNSESRSATESQMDNQTLTADDRALVDHIAIQANRRIADYVGEYIAAIRTEQSATLDMLAALKPFAAFALAREATWKDMPDDTSYFGKKPVGHGTVIQVIHQSGNISIGDFRRARSAITAAVGDRESDPASTSST